ncbi:MAG: GNAT family N-acetyltransferase [Anaerolineales bacterium]|jgi:GNAT superfamily N-acetyltransferase
MTSIVIRPYREEDAPAIGRLIADTYARYNLNSASGELRDKMLGPFREAYSTDPEHQRQIAEVIRASVVYVAEAAGEIVGVLRGSPGRLSSLFVSGERHRQGIGRQLMQTFEDYCRAQGAAKITMASTLYAVPFYQSLGYKKSTGTRRLHSFEGVGLAYQPMKKVLVSGGVDPG